MPEMKDRRFFAGTVSEKKASLHSLRDRFRRVNCTLSFRLSRQDPPTQRSKSTLNRLVAGALSERRFRSIGMYSVVPYSIRAEREDERQRHEERIRHAFLQYVTSDDYRAVRLVLDRIFKPV